MNKNIIIILIIILCNIQIVNAQQTVFNVPNADVTPKDTLFLEHESQFRAWNPGSYWWGTHYAAYGIGHHTDIDASLVNLEAPNSHNMSLGLGFKSVFPICQSNKICHDRELKFTVGSEVLIPMQNNGVGNWSYAHFSGRLPKVNTRLTAGISVGTRQIYGANEPVSFIAAVEQPVTKKLNIIGDWYSGNHNYYGYLIAGVSYKLPKDSCVYLGYQIPNDPRNGKSGFVVELSTFIPCRKSKANKNNEISSNINKIDNTPSIETYNK